jgi:hypothetical protein
MAVFFAAVIVVSGYLFASTAVRIRRRRAEMEDQLEPPEE